MPKFKVYITVYHAIDIEAENKSKALDEAEQDAESSEKED